MRTSALFLALLAGCASGNEQTQRTGDDAEVRICTRIGCSNGLAIEVNHAFQQSFTVTVRSGAQVIHTFRCEPREPCRSFAENQTPSAIVVVVDGPNGQVTRPITPQYGPNRPNGPDCPPECRQAVVNVDVT